jgi:hypothetical protein
MTASRKSDSRSHYFQVRAAGEDGMTIIEVMVAALILIFGSFAVLGLVDVGARNTFRAEQSQVVSDRLQQEMEAIKHLPFSQVALTGVPASSNNEADPSWRVQGTSFAVEPSGINLKPLAYNGGALVTGGTLSGGTVNPTPTVFTNGDVHGLIYRYVVWENDDACADSLCPGAQDFKRVIVAVKLNETASGGHRAYQELQARIVDPATKPFHNPNPIDPNETTDKPWTFFLSDTTCNNTTRQPITGGHPTHNTRGVCATGLTNGNNPGAPDLMFTEAPPLTGEQPIWDYSSDVEPSINGGADKGLQLLRSNSNGCLTSLLDYTGVPDIAEPDRFQKVHKWLSLPMPAGTDVQLNQTGTLDLWTQSVNGAIYPGKICVWLFQRELNVLGAPIDTPAVSLDTGGINYFTYEQAQWPTTWTEIHVPLHFLLNVHLIPQSRLGVAITVERANTGASGLEFMYDEPSFDSRLELTSQSTLPSF